jgi:hypothetical protein
VERAAVGRSSVGVSTHRRAGIATIAAAAAAKGNRSSDREDQSGTSHASSVVQVGHLNHPWPARCRRSVERAVVKRDPGSSCRNTAGRSRRRRTPGTRNRNRRCPRRARASSRRSGHWAGRDR